MEKLVQGKYYHVCLLSPYSAVGDFDVVISSIAKKATLSYYGEYDIRENLFIAAGVEGIGTYLSTVTDDTDIYVCHTISSYDPPEVDDGDFIFIPASIVDHSSTEEYKEVVRYQLNIEGIRRHFDTDGDRYDFVDGLEKVIPAVLARETVLANDVLSISTTEEELIVQESVIKKEEEEREKFIQEREKAIRDREIADANREMNYYERMSKLKKEEEETARIKAEYTNLIRQGEVSKNIGAKFLLNVNDFMNKIKDLYAQFTTYANTYGFAIPDWDNLFRLVYTEANGRGGSNITTDEWAQMMALIAQGDIPEEMENVELSDCPLCGTHVEDIINGTSSSSNRKVSDEEENE